MSAKYILRGFWIRLVFALFLFLCAVLIYYFPTIFPEYTWDELYGSIIQNDWYTKLQNYVMMILYD